MYMDLFLTGKMPCTFAENSIIGNRWRVFDKIPSRGGITCELGPSAIVGTCK